MWFVKLCKVALFCSFAAFLAVVVWLEAAHAAGPKIVILGDSLSAGHRLSRGQDFGSQLQAALDRKGLSAMIVNRSRAGRTTAGGVRALRSVPADVDGLILQLGGNDGLRRISARRAEANLEKILAAMKARNVPVLIAGIGTLPDRGTRYARQFEAMYSGLSRKYRAGLYPNFLTGIYGNPALVLRDGIHPNANGVAKIVRQVMPSVVRLIGKARKG